MSYLQMRDRIIAALTSKPIPWRFHTLNEEDEQPEFGKIYEVIDFRMYETVLIRDQRHPYAGHEATIVATGSDDEQELHLRLNKPPGSLVRAHVNQIQKIQLEPQDGMLTSPSAFIKSQLSGARPSRGSDILFPVDQVCDPVPNALIYQEQHFERQLISHEPSGALHIRYVPSGKRWDAKAGQWV